MIHLASSKEVKLDRGDIRLIEERLDEIKSICDQELDENPNSDVKRKINAVEFVIQRGRQ